MRIASVIAIADPVSEILYSCFACQDHCFPATFTMICICPVICLVVMFFVSLILFEPSLLSLLIILLILPDPATALTIFIINCCIIEIRIQPGNKTMCQNGSPLL